METNIKAGDWTRPCRDCGTVEESCFDVGSKRDGKTYRKSYCRTCARVRVKANDRQNPEMKRARDARRSKRDWHADTLKRWAQEDPVARRQKIRNANTRRTHGISADEYAFRFQQQGGLCAICAKEISLGRSGPHAPAHLDHDYKTGALREFLCSHCNVMVGMAHESEDILATAILYLEKHNGY